MNAGEIYVIWARSGHIRTRGTCKEHAWFKNDESLLQSLLLVSFSYFTVYLRYDTCRNRTKTNYYYGYFLPCLFVFLYVFSTKTEDFSVFCYNPITCQSILLSALKVQVTACGRDIVTHDNCLLDEGFFWLMISRFLVVMIFVQAPKLKRLLGIGGEKAISQTE